MNTSKKSNIIMDELTNIVNGNANNHIVNGNANNQTNQDKSESKEPVPLTVQDVIDKLTDLVDVNPDIAKYQIAEYNYDDFAVGPAYAVFSVKGIDVIELPEDSEDEFVDNKLTSSNIVLFHT